MSELQFALFAAGGIGFVAGIAFQIIVDKVVEHVYGP